MGGDKCQFHVNGCIFFKKLKNKKMMGPSPYWPRLCYKYYSKMHVFTCVLFKCTLNAKAVCPNRHPIFFRLVSSQTITSVCSIINNLFFYHFSILLINENWIVILFSMILFYFQLFSEFF